MNNAVHSSGASTAIMAMLFTDLGDSTVRMERVGDEAEL